jgi:putative flippase GtrA
MPLSKAHFSAARKRFCLPARRQNGPVSRQMTASSSFSIAQLVRALSEVKVVRFGVVGVSNATISFAVFWSAHHLMPAMGAQCLSYAVGMLWSYYWNRRWTFQSQGRVAGEASRFFTLQIGFMLLSSGLLGLLVDRSHWPSGPTWLGVMVLVTVLNFLASRFWAFKTS